MKDVAENMEVYMGRTYGKYGYGCGMEDVTVVMEVYMEGMAVDAEV